MYTIEIKGHHYHATPIGDIDTCEPTEELVLITDESGYPIPVTTCLCFAHSSSECCCGAWYRYKDEYDR
jgi:hypothetical protein